MRLKESDSFSVPLSWYAGRGRGEGRMSKRKNISAPFELNPILLGKTPHSTRPLKHPNYSCPLSIGASHASRYHPEYPKFSPTPDIAIPNGASSKPRIRTAGRSQLGRTA